MQSRILWSIGHVTVLACPRIAASSRRIVSGYGRTVRRRPLAARVGDGRGRPSSTGSPAIRSSYGRRTCATCRWGRLQTTGTFAHPMKSLGQSGLWETSFPGSARAGLQFELHPPAGRRLRAIRSLCRGAAAQTAGHSRHRLRLARSHLDGSAGIQTQSSTADMIYECTRHFVAPSMEGSRHGANWRSSSFLT
jgi:hypothetical protein